MLELIRKKGVKSCVQLFIVGIVLLVLSLVLSKFAFFYYIKGPIVLKSDMKYEDVLGKYVTYDVEFNLDEYIRNISKNSDTGKETLKGVGYLIYNTEQDNIFCMKLDASKRFSMDTMITETWDYFNEKTETLPRVYTVVGTLEKIPGKEMSYFDSTIKDYYPTYLDKAYPYVINTKTVMGIDIGWVWASIFGVVIGLLIAIYAIVKILANNFHKNLAKYVSTHPDVTMEEMEAEFHKAQVVGKIARVGQRWTFDLNGMTPKLIENESIIWAYYYYTTGRSSQSLVRLYDINKKAHAINAPRALATEILQNFAENQPHIVIGYAKETLKMYNKDFQSFLNLKYYPAQVANPVNNESSEQTTGNDYDNL